MGAQGVFYVLTGLWPLIDLPSFEAVTGPKADEWLVHMVGLLAGVIGVTLVLAVLRVGSRSAELLTLAIGSALAFAGIDLWYGLSGRISPVYLADATVEIGWIILLGLTSRGRRAER
jgi:hypothetical protein